MVVDGDGLAVRYSGCSSAWLQLRCQRLADLAVRARVRSSARVREACGSRPGLAASPCALRGMSGHRVQQFNEDFAAAAHLVTRLTWIVEVQVRQEYG
jgi:hypothetical protein